MELTKVKKVGIIGAGVAGLSTAKLLIEQGLECVVFERGDTLGGVWADGYSNFGVQVQKELYEFPDWPLPKEVPNFTSGPVIQEYLEDYAQLFGVKPHIQFNSVVANIEERANGDSGWTVTYHHAGTRQQEDFDLVVVCIGLYSNQPNMPEFPGQDQFQGEILHISDLKTTEALDGKKVAVVGFGKSATDAAAESAAVAAETTIIFREAHWPVPPKLAGILPFKWAMFNRLTSTLIPQYHRASPVERVVHTLAKPLVWLWWRIVELLLIIQCGLWSRFGTRLSLVPTTPVEVDTFSEATMLPRTGFYRLLRKGIIKPQRTRVVEYTPKGVVLENGATIKADVVVLATGWKTDYSFLPEKARANINFEEDGFYLYWQMVHPDVSNFVFVGATATFSNILTQNLQARWLGELIKGHHSLPSRETMLQEIQDIKRWKREWMPYSPGRGARLGLHMLHYHDDFLKDIGEIPRRKKGIFAPVKEVLAPYQPADYDTVVSGR